MPSPTVGYDFFLMMPSHSFCHRYIPERTSLANRCSGVVILVKRDQGEVYRGQAISPYSIHSNGTPAFIKERNPHAQ